MPRRDAGLGDVAQGIVALHRAGRVGRAHQQQAVELLRRIRRFDRRRRDREAIGRIDRQVDGLDAQRPENVAIGRIAGILIATRAPASNKARKAMTKPPDEPVVTATRCGIELDAIGLAIMAARCARAARQAQRVGIADRLAAQSARWPPRAPGAAAARRARRPPYGRSRPRPAPAGSPRA